MPLGSLLLAVLVPAALETADITFQASAPSCTVPAAVVRVAELPEASGIASSPSGAVRYWAHNDSGKAELIALDAAGKALGRVSITGASIDDWEAMGAGPCGSAACLYIADIGDNEASRKDIIVYRVEPPASASGSARVKDVLRATYPDGAHDAEALLVGPDGRIHVLTKGETGPIALYRFPRDLRDGVMRLERVGAPLNARKVGEADRVTDAAISQDGRWVALRTKTSVRIFPGADFLQGKFNSVATIDLRPLEEPQGEGIAFDARGNLIVAGEGGGKSQAGTFAVLSCR